MKYLLTILFVFICGITMASCPSDSTRGVWMRLQGGVGVGSYRDFGAAPITFKGLELDPGMSVLVDRGLWRFEGSVAAAGGGYGFALGIKYFQAYGGAPVLSLSVHRQLTQIGRWKIWAGAALEECCDIRYSSALGNSCIGVSNFVNINALGTAEYEFGSWILKGHMVLTPMAFLFRPGYAYMDNYDQEIGDPNGNLFDQYNHYVSWANGLATEVCLLYQIGNGNRFGVSYRWNYRTSRTSRLCPHLFQQAGHALVLNLDFAL